MAAEDLDTGLDTKNVKRNFIVKLISSFVIYDDEGVVFLTILKNDNIKVQAWYVTVLYKYFNVQLLRGLLPFRRYTVNMRNKIHEHLHLLCNWYQYPQGRYLHVLWTI